MHQISTCTEGRPLILVNLFCRLTYSFKNIFQSKVADLLFVFLKHGEKRHIALAKFFNHHFSSSTSSFTQ